MKRNLKHISFFSSKDCVESKYTGPIILTFCMVFLTLHSLQVRESRGNLFISSISIYKISITKPRPFHRYLDGKNSQNVICLEIGGNGWYYLLTLKYLKAHEFGASSDCQVEMKLSVFLFYFRPRKVNKRLTI